MKFLALYFDSKSREVQEDVDLLCHKQRIETNDVQGDF